MSPGSAPTSGSYAAALSQFDRAADQIELDPNLREVLRCPKRELTVNFPVEMDDGSITVFTGYRVQHNVTPRSGQGRHPLPPQRRPGRSSRPGHVDDVEVRRDEPALRRGQGRRDRRSAHAEPA